MSSFVLDKFGSNCRLKFGEECVSVDFEGKRITTSSGRTIQYDLLLAADGVNSRIREFLVQKEQELFQEQHYLEDIHWKALQLPKQPDIEAGSFKPLQHPSFSRGRVLPRAPEGHILLLFWKEEHGIENPAGVETTDDLKQMITEAMHGKNTRGTNPLRKLLGFNRGDSDRKRDWNEVFDEAALEDFISKRAGRTHHLKINQYHFQDSVALIGDSAHAMNSLLGQGCAAGLQSTYTLVECLGGCDDQTLSIEESLLKYSQLATREAYAITDLNLIHYATRGRMAMLKALPLAVWNKLRGRSLRKQLSDITVPYSQIAAENKGLLKLSRRNFEKERRPFVNPGIAAAIPTKNELELSQ
ncbi:unnamed protein product [Cylindrotheca closterium]|uniref:FAD-binding domain-containing protein n=1 Tax=Cylindrotheca closterium TaxID=2856 RepID=A0AAD2FTQ7_9STRA|nr:unnamed protein product [Cylindrotheca closterium]